MKDRMIFRWTVIFLLLIFIPSCSRYTRCKDCDGSISDQSAESHLDAAMEQSPDTSSDIDLCQGISCTTPPADECQGDSLRSYETTGICNPDNGICSYGYNDTLCDHGCKAGACLRFLDTITYVKASNTDPYDHFGFNVAIDGDTMVVGAPLEDSCAKGVDGDDTNDFCADSGAAYVFVRSAGIWTQEAYLKASNTEPGDHFGETVYISGDTIIVGAPSEDSCSPNINGNENENSCYQAGAAYVFVRSGTTWTQEAYLKASNPDNDDFFSIGVTISGDTIAVGAFYEDSCSAGINGDETDNNCNNSGATYVFVRSGTTWTQEAYLKTDYPDPSDHFGWNLSIDQDTLVVGARDEDSCNNDPTDNNCSNAGAAYVFVRNGATWTQEAYLKATFPDFDDLYADDVSISNDTIVVGSVFEGSCSSGLNGNELDNNCTKAGAAYVYTRNGGVWTKEAYIKASNTDASDRFGNKLSISANALLIGADQEASCSDGINQSQTDSSCLGAGAAYLLIRNGTTWTQKTYLKSELSEANDEYSNGVSLSGDTFVIGVPFEDSCDTGINGIQNDNACADAGAVYIYSPVQY